MSEKNNGLNEFNQRQINYRAERSRRRARQRIAVLLAFLVLISILVVALWFVVLEIKENLVNDFPGDDGGERPTVTTGPASSDTEPTDSQPPASDTTPTETDPPATTPPVTTSGINYMNKTYTKPQMYKGSLILINEDHPFVVSSDMDLVTIKELRDQRGKVDGVWPIYFMANYVQMNKAAANALLDMATACNNETKINDLCISTYGAYREDLPATDVYFKSGLSVYLIGYPAPNKYPALDDSSYKNGAVMAEWLEANAYKYGFVKRFTSSKTSVTGQPEDVGHYRYVGVVHANIMHKNNLCLEEYISMLAQNHLYTGTHYTAVVDGHNYEIYYVPSEGDVTIVPVPTALPYEISGDNANGFIVTVTLD